MAPLYGKTVQRRSTPAPMPVPRTVYFPFPLWLIAIFLLGLALLFTLVSIDLIGYAYQRIGLSPNEAFTLLLASLLGSAINLPVLRLKGESTVQESIVRVYGVPTRIPTILEHQDTLIMVNVGGALIPTLWRSTCSSSSPFFCRPCSPPRWWL